MKLARLIAEVFAPLLHVAYAALWYLSLAGALALVDQRPWRLGVADFAALGTLITSLFYLRLADEWKDLAYDRLHHPERPLVRGLVDRRDLTRYMLGSAALVLALNVALLETHGAWPLLIAALDLAWGAGLIALERTCRRVRDGLFVNLVLTYPVQIALSVYVYAVGLAGRAPSAWGASLILAFALAFLHYELARKTARPEHARPGERLYSAALGGAGALALATGCALGAVALVSVLLAPRAGAVPLIALLPVGSGAWRFVRARASRARLAPHAAAFLLLFYLSVSALVLQPSAAGGLGLAGFVGWCVLGAALLAGTIWLAQPRPTPDRVASLYYTATDELRAGNDTMLFQLVEPLELERVRDSYARWVRGRDALRVRWAQCTPTQSFVWLPLSEAELEARLAEACRGLSEYRSLRELDAAYEPKCSSLPCRLSMLDPRRLVLSFDHAFCNGYGAAFWFDDFLRCHRALCAGLPLPAVRESLEPRPTLARRLLSAAGGLSAVVAFFAHFFGQLRAHSAADTVNLSHGRRPARQRGYTVRRCELDAEQTANIVAAARSRHMTFGEAVALELVKLLFEAQPAQRRVLVSVPIDLGRYLPGLSRTQPGNFTGSVCVQFFRDRDLERQVRRAFTWPRRGVPYWLSWLFARFAPSEFALRDLFASAAQKPLAERGPYDDHSCAFSNLNTSAELGELSRSVERYGAHSKTQTIFISAIRLHSRLNLECCFSNDLYDPAEVLPLFDALPARLLVAAAAAARVREPDPAGVVSVQS